MSSILTIGRCTGEKLIAPDTQIPPGVRMRLAARLKSALSVAFASEAQNEFGLKGMDMIIVKTTHTLLITVHGNICIL